MDTSPKQLKPVPKSRTLLQRASLAPKQHPIL